MTRVLRDARLASGLVTRSGRLLQGEPVPPSSRSSSSSASTPSGGPPKRCATAVMLETLTSGLAAVREPRLVRERFEEELRALVRATSVTFRQDGDETRRPNVVACEVPGSPPFERRSWLEAVFEPTRPADDRPRQMLAAGAQVAGLLLENGAGQRLLAAGVGPQPERRCRPPVRIQSRHPHRARSHRARRRDRLHRTD